MAVTNREEYICKGAAYTHGVTVLEKILPGQNIADVSFYTEFIGQFVHLRLKR